MLDCSSCRDHLSDMQRGLLDEELLVQMRIHLEDCEFCRSYQQQHENDPGWQKAGNGSGKSSGKLDTRALWYERFERPRETRLSRKKLKLIQMAVIFGAFSLMLLGLRMRGDRMNRVIAPGVERSAESIVALLTTELQLEPRDAEVFFPLLRSYRLQADSLDIAIAEGRTELKSLSREYSPINQRIPELNQQLEDLAAYRVSRRRTFFQAVREQLGAARENRLRSLQSEWDH